MKDAKLEILLAELIQKELDGALLDEQFAQLQDMLSDDDGALEYYIETVLTMSALHEPQGSCIELDGPFLFSENIEDSPIWQSLAEEENIAPAVLIEKPKREPVKMIPVEKAPHEISRLSLYTLFTSVAAMLFVALFLKMNPPIHSVYVGTLERSLHGQWEDPSGRISDGCDLYAGPMQLSKGMAEIVFSSGARVTIEAPAEFNIESPSQMFLHRGRVTVLAEDLDSPYVVRTPSSSVVDMGTEFGVLVDRNQLTTTHVYEGLVELRSGSDPLRYEKELTLTTNQAGRVDSLGGISTAPPQPGLFVRSNEYAIKVKAADGSTYHRWLAYSLELRRDPDLVAYYTFDDEGVTAGQIVNQALETKGKLDGILGDGVLVKMPTRVAGRWPQKKCMKFDRSKLQHIVIPHDPSLSIQNQISLSFWLFLDSDSSGGHLLSKRIGGGDIEYQAAIFGDINVAGVNSNKLQFGAGMFPGGGLNYVSSITWQPGKWHHYVITFDGMKITYYLDGRIVSTQLHLEKMIPCIEPLRIGTDWAGGDPINFDGLMGELAIFKRTVSASEVRQMFKAGSVSDDK